jgi:hypothetical protein
VQASLVVQLDPVLDAAARRSAVGPGIDADLGLERGEERLGGGAVETASGPADSTGAAS